ncbi:hypothetical protein MASR1M6_08430 [Rubrivivax sp.]
MQRAREGVGRERVRALAQQVTQRRAGAERGREARHRIGTDDGHGDAAVLQHRAHALARVAGIDRDVGAAGLPDGDQGDDEVQPAAIQQRHVLPRADAAGDERVGEALAACIELAPAQGRCAVHRADRARVLRRQLFVDQRGEGRPRRHRKPQRVEAAQYAMALGSVAQRELAQGAALSAEVDASRCASWRASGGRLSAR